MTDRTTTRGRRRGWWYLLLLIPFIVPLLVPLYGSASPAFAGIPFFYWYQFLWVLLGALITALVYFLTD